MSAKNTGGAKAPRKHQAHWKDNTSTARTQERNAALNEIAGKFGWFSKKTGKPSWSAFETACLNGTAQPTLREPDESHAAPGAGGSE
jgi:hypothetical protein